MQCAKNALGLSFYCLGLVRGRTKDRQCGLRTKKAAGVVFNHPSLQVYKQQHLLNYIHRSTGNRT